MLDRSSVSLLQNTILLPHIIIIFEDTRDVRRCESTQRYRHRRPETLAAAFAEMQRRLARWSCAAERSSQSSSRRLGVRLKVRRTLHVVRARAAHPLEDKVLTSVVSGIARRLRSLRGQFESGVRLVSGLYRR